MRGEEKDGGQKKEAEAEEKKGGMGGDQRWTELARRLAYLPEPDWTDFDQRLERVDKMLSGLIRRQKQTGGEGREA